ncbi:hypothetical protein LIER_41842 [Lithospermum erythrorhizon]|uniref:Retrotransposon Copia-like N-terminal domain-containing protein n=1 Tax=Lithospermum erythrorhizon TaxID=34254 RepID=A0AAV3RFA9_LITER
MRNKKVNPTPVDDPENSTPEQNKPITPTPEQVPPNPHDPDAAVVYRRIDPLSPYYLGSNDHPGNLICLVKLIGKNYEEWSRSMKLSLRDRQKYGFIDGTIVKPTNPDFLRDWDAL